MNLHELITLLNKGYLIQYDTEIVGGYNEPFYKASQVDQKAQIQFSYDYIRSALHELSHWCVAGEKRRKLDDYGYWYAEDGRNQQQQNEFFKVEIKPQTIEWAFSLVCGVKFEVSVDNLNNKVKGLKKFKYNIKQQMLTYLNDGFPVRAGEILIIMAQYRTLGDPYAYIKGKLEQKI